MWPVNSAQVGKTAVFRTRRILIKDFIKLHIPVSLIFFHYSIEYLFVVCGATIVMYYLFEMRCSINVTSIH